MMAFGFWWFWWWWFPRHPSSTWASRSTRSISARSSCFSSARSFVSLRHDLFRHGRPHHGPLRRCLLRHSRLVLPQYGFRPSSMWLSSMTLLDILLRSPSSVLTDFGLSKHFETGHYSDGPAAKTIKYRRPRGHEREDPRRAIRHLLRHDRLVLPRHSLPSLFGFLRYSPDRS